ncbi:unnamed protein product [Prorocentrum cordatum]|uniref:Uncharacterized protein n=1 Tax=Prorocentrum cordatum TaxID=2364126 RepID=A0ABN9TEH3_9DINO|nr:unnamed protein product [Polarella glacialis]
MGEAGWLRLRLVCGRAAAFGATAFGGAQIPGGYVGDDALYLRDSALRRGREVDVWDSESDGSDWGGAKPDMEALGVLGGGGHARSRREPRSGSGLLVSGQGVVVEAIDTMVGNLRDEQASDDEKKDARHRLPPTESRRTMWRTSNSRSSRNHPSRRNHPAGACEANRMEDTRSAVLAGRAIDEASDTISQLTSDVGELDSQLTQKEEQGEAIVEQLAAAEAQRNEEHAAFVSGQKDDEDAATTVASAIEVLEAFYKQNTVFVQRAGAKEPVEVAAGQAPPPPPKTWSEPEYGGRTTESDGIIMILTMIKDDILKDKAASEEAEHTAAELYAETSQALTKEKDALDGQIDEMKIAKGEKAGTIESTRSERSLKKDELDVIMEKVKAVQPGCDFFQVNYLVRKKNRLIELDGLLKAKAILAGTCAAGLPERWQDPERAGKSSGLPLEPPFVADIRKARQGPAARAPREISYSRP